MLQAALATLLHANLSNGSEFQHKTLALGFQIPREEVFEPQKPIQKKTQVFGRLGI